MSNSRPHQITADHLRKLAIVYVRQSSLEQVRENQGSTAHQRAQVEHPRRWGWPESQILLIEDLGLSGTSGDRPGWKRQLNLIAQDQVGIICVSEHSRLSRSTKDFAVLLTLCAEMNVLLSVDGNIVDPREPGARFATKVLATAGEFENDLRRERFMNGRWARARDGYAVSYPPTGYVKIDKGRWAKDPDAAVQHAIEQVFARYLALGTVGKLLAEMVAKGRMLPIRWKDGSLEWVRPTRMRLYCILSNPAYRGACVYGRTTAGRGKRHGKRVWTKPDRWLCVEGRHEPYVSAAVWKEIQTRLHQNRITVKQPAGTGSALLQGILWDAKCGRKMSTYPYTTRRGPGYEYSCNQANAQYGLPYCRSLEARRVDAVVQRELFARLTPTALEDVLAEAQEANAGYEAAVRARQYELERARYDIDLAWRRYAVVDPANRLAAADLETKYNQALERLRQLEQQHAETPLEPPLQVTPDFLAEVQQIAGRVAEVWAAPTTTHQDRKALVRLCIQEVRLIELTEVESTFDIVWASGTVTRHSALRAKAGAVIARQLQAQGFSIPQIAEELNRRGLRTRTKGEPYTPETLRSVIRWGLRPKRPPRQRWLRHREALRSVVTELCSRGLTNKQFAQELTARGLESYSRRPWSKEMVGHLLRALGLQQAAAQREPGETLKAV